jgi:hypothetical protein
MDTDWNVWLSCPQCPAVLGEPCLALLGAGPQALLSRPQAVPHSGRKRRGAAKAPAAKPRGAASSTSAGRRTARKQQSTADAWLALAERRRQG